MKDEGGVIALIGKRERVPARRDSFLVFVPL